MFLAEFKNILLLYHGDQHYGKSKTGRARGKLAVIHRLLRIINYYVIIEVVLFYGIAGF